MVADYHEICCCFRRELLRLLAAARPYLQFGYHFRYNDKQIMRHRQKRPVPHFCCAKSKIRICGGRQGMFDMDFEGR